jgi:hypothetical protein
MRNDIFLWDASTGQRLNKSDMGHSFELLYVAFSPNQRRVLTCSFDFTARVWDARTGQALSPPLPHRQRVSWGAFSADGQNVVTASWDKTVRVWEASTGRPVTAPLLHQAIVVGAFWSADGQRLTTITEDDHMQVWDLENGEPLTPPTRTQGLTTPPSAAQTLSSLPLNEALPQDDRPVADLVLLGQMLAVGRIDASGNVVPLELSDLTRAWPVVHDKYPKQFRASGAEVVDWHRREAHESQVEGNLRAALFHLDRAIQCGAQDSALAEERATAATALARADSAVGTKAKGLYFIPPRGAECGSEQVDLSTHYNLGLGDSVRPSLEHDDCAELPEGLRALGGVRFDIRGLIRLRGQAQNGKASAYPQCAKSIRVGRKCRRLHFLQGSSSGSTDGDQIGSYVLHYADGQSVELPLVYGRDLKDWWFFGAPTVYEGPGAARVVWTGSNRAAAQFNGAICLYESVRENPRPEVELVSIDFLSDTLSPASPFLVALTVE